MGTLDMVWSNIADLTFAEMMVFAAELRDASEMIGNVDLADARDWAAVVQMAMECRKGADA